MVVSHNRVELLRDVFARAYRASALRLSLIGMLRRKAEKIIIDTALKGLKKRVEALG